MNENEYQDRIRELERALRYAGECSTLGMVRDTVRGAGVLDAPASGVIIKPVHWHPGGAQIDKTTGEPYPWPWGEEESPGVIATGKSRLMRNGEWRGLTTVCVDAWCNINWYADPADLEPSAIG